MTRWIAVSIIVLAALPLGCGGELNPAYCRAHPDDADCPRIDAAIEIDAPIVACSSPDDCRAPTPICELTEQICVQCTMDTDCTGNKPVCDTGPNVCRACSAHSECLSGVCLTDGSCADAANVKYVQGGAPAGNTLCTQALPCPNVAAALAAPLKSYFVLSGTITDSGAATIDNRTVTIIGAPGSSITRTSNGTIFDIKGTSNVTIDGLAIKNSLGDGVFIHETASATLTRVKIHNNTDNGITFSVTVPTARLSVVDSQIHHNGVSGITTTTMGALTVTDSLVYNNVSSGISATTTGLVTIGSSVIAFNGGGGGLVLSADYAVTNSIIAANGSTSSLVGGVQLATGNPAAVFQFNTVANNVTGAGVGGGVRGINCTAATVGLTNSILTGEIAGACTVTYSLTSATTAGFGNKTGAPLFLDVGGDPLLATFYRITNLSPAKDSANPAATVTVDIDGDTRLGVADMGADEAP